MPYKRKLRVASPKTPATSRPAAIDHARTDAMASIARQRDLGGKDNAFLEKAHMLLTRHWAKAGWTARASLLDNANWLIRLAGRGGGHIPEEAKPRASDSARRTREQGKPGQRSPE